MSYFPNLKHHGPNNYSLKEEREDRRKEGGKKGRELKTKKKEMSQVKLNKTEEEAIGKG